MIMFKKMKKKCFICFAIQHLTVILQDSIRRLKCHPNTWMKKYISNFLVNEDTILQKHQKQNMTEFSL